MFFQVNSFQVTAASTRHVYEPDQVRHQHYAFEECKNDLASAIPLHGVLHFILVNLLLIIPIVCCECHHSSEDPRAPAFSHGRCQKQTEDPDVV